MQQKKNVNSVVAVFGIQVFDAGLGQIEKRPVFRQVLLVGIEKIGEQAEVNILIAIGQEPDL